jgi:hypothetical protein
VNYTINEYFDYERQMVAFAASLSAMFVTVDTFELAECLVGTDCSEDSDAEEM